jgi:hypothetical protein
LLIRKPRVGRPPPEVCSRTNAVRRGFFPDVKTIAAALLSRSFSLGELAKFLQTPCQKQSPDEHGGPLTVEYIDYAMQDAQVTWECS